MLKFPLFRLSGLQMLILSISLLLTTACSMPIAPLVNSSTLYEQHKVHNPDGIGKFYMDREIAQVGQSPHVSTMSISFKSLQNRVHLTLSQIRISVILGSFEPHSS
jgi:hypothetical protein